MKKDETIPITVGEYLFGLNIALKDQQARLIGEVVNLKLYEGRSYMYFSIKDKEGKGLLNCFMWKRDYQISGVELEDGMEVVIHGYPKIYEPNGSISFQTDTVELVGEGALKKAYDKLKLKLEKEGLLAEEKKRPIPDYPHKIGVITSKDGAVLSDFTTNIGKFGYNISFINSRVEGQVATSDLLNAVKTLAKKDIDVLVIMRGGGSLESFMAFNNESLVRAIAEFPVPVIAGIGHDKDICLVSLVADRMVSTPTAAAQLLNKSWEQALSKVRLYERELLSSFQNALFEKKQMLAESSSLIKERFKSIFDNFERVRHMFEQGVLSIGYRIKEMKTSLAQSSKNIVHGFEKQLTYGANLLNLKEKELFLMDPERQLKLGYSIVRSEGKIVKSIKGLSKGKELELRLADGEVITEIKQIN